MSDLIVILLNAATLTSILMLVGLGLAIIFGLMRVLNLAHGEFVAIGAFAMVVAHDAGLGFVGGLMLAMAVGALGGLLLEWGIVRHLYDRPIQAILATWGVSLAFQQLLQLAFGTGARTVPAPIKGAVEIMGTAYPAYRLLLITLALLIFVALAIAMRKTSLGLDLRAVIQNREMAESVGINTARTFSISFAIGSAVAAVAGALVAPLVSILPQIGVNYLANSFFVVIVGGVGSMGGVLAGSAFIGGLDSLIAYQLSPSLSRAIVLLLAIILVRFRPQGLVKP
ncbi:branched-chain amino acid ABC transporter permease [Sulfitobacter alexandrii]|nr:branched-chain amino acid ABC transporter permease [Sulfitobacter alexandrii]